MSKPMSLAQMKGNLTKASKYLKYDEARLRAHYERKKLREQKLLEQLSILQAKLKLYDARLLELASTPTKAGI